jgi:hypothetical protein
MLDIEQMIAKMKPHTRFPSIGDDQDKPDLRKEQPTRRR